MPQCQVVSWCSQGGGTMRYLLSREVSGYREYWCFSPVRNCYTFSKHVFSAFSQKLSFFFFKLNEFLPKISVFCGKINTALLPALFWSPKVKGVSEELYPRGWIFSCAYYERLLGGSKADLEELKIKPKFCTVLCVLQTKSNIYFLLQPWLRHKMWKKTLFFLTESSKISGVPLFPFSCINFDWSDVLEVCSYDWLHV